MTRGDILLIGGGGHCASCVEAIESAGEWRIAGVVGDASQAGGTVFGYPFLGVDEDLPVLAEKIGAATISVGQILYSSARRRLYLAAIEAGFTLPAIAASSAIVSRHAAIGAGTQLLHRTVVNARATVGENCIVNTGAVIEHDVQVGAHTHVSTGAILNGGCAVGADCFIGSGAVVRQGIRIIGGAIIGAGAVVIADILESGTYAGCPARKIR